MKIRALAALAAGAALTACGSHAASTTAAATGIPSAAAVVSKTPAAAVPRLTIRQARRTYVRIVDAANRAASAMGGDVTDVAPFSQYQADAHRYVSLTRSAGRHLGAVRWPTRVQPYITSMLLTYDPASIRCAQAESGAGTYSAAVLAAAANKDCAAADASTLPDTVRSMLGLPARS